MVFVKFLEQNCRKGEFSHLKLAGKRVVEVGAGCGLAGLGMALLGCHVVATDQVEVLALLIRNLERNMARAKHSPSESPYLGSLGTIEVAELNWGDPAQIRALNPPFDYIIGSDIVYKEKLLEPLLTTLLGLAGPKTTILLANELRSSIVHERMLQLWKENFTMKTIPRSKMDSKYQHENIQLFSLKPKVSGSVVQEETVQGHVSLDVGEACSKDTRELLQESYTPAENLAPSNASESRKEVNPSSTMQSVSTDVQALQIHEGDAGPSANHDHVDTNNSREEISCCSKPNDWEIRRLGSMAARLLQNAL